MALGEKVTFDINRFYLHYVEPNAIAITCVSQEEIDQAINIIKKFTGNISFAEEDNINNIYNIWEDKSPINWVNLYTTGSHTIRVVTDVDCTYGSCNSDYYFSDIDFGINGFDIPEIKPMDLLNFLEE